MAAFFALLWGAELLFPGTFVSAVVLIGATIFGFYAVRPDWNLRPAYPRPYWIGLFALIFATAAIAAGSARFMRLTLPYDRSMSLFAVLPGLVAITGVEEALFRQGMFRWLERHGVRARTVVITTALIFGLGHLGPLIIGRTSLVAFTLLQSLSLVWVGLLLGEIRRVTNSWLMSWLAHAGYNSVLLSIVIASF